MIRIGAVMSDELVQSFRQSLDSNEVAVAQLGPSFSRMRSYNPADLQGLVCELSETALDGYADRDASLRSIPCAGLPVVSHAQALAREAGITAVIRGPEDLSEWMSSIAVPASVSAGPIIAIWGPAGSPGRSTIALCLAVTLARRGERVMLVDGDTYAPSLAPLLGLHTPHSGVVSLSRQARVDSVLAPNLETCAVQYDLGHQSLSVVTGLSSPAQYVDCGSLSWARGLTSLSVAGHTLVVDLASPLLQLPGETLGGPMRNALTIATLEAAGRVVVVANPTPLSILRLSRDWPRLSELVQTAPLDVCLNNAPASAQTAIDDSVHALWQLTGRGEATIFPSDRLWSRPSASVAGLLSSPEAKSPLLMSVGRHVSSQWGILERHSPRSGRLGESAHRKPGFSMPNWAQGKKRLP
jgi:hypothetical protein